MAEELSQQDQQFVADALAARSQNVAIPTVSDSADFVNRIGRTAASTFSPFLQSVAQIEGDTAAADYFAQQRAAMAVNQPGDIAPINPANDGSVSATIADTIGSAVPRAAILAGTGGLGLPLLAGETLAQNSVLVPEQQAAYDELSPEEQAKLGHRPTMMGANVEGLGTLAAFGAVGPALARAGMPFIAAVPKALRPATGIGVNTLGNVVSDIGIRSGVQALKGESIEPFKSPQDFAASAVGGTIFGAHPGIGQARGVPAFLQARAKAKAIADLAAANAKFEAAAKAEAAAAEASKVQTVAPNEPAPDAIEVKPATEDATGLAIEPAKAMPAVTPTTAMPMDLQLNPNAAKSVEQTSTKDPQVVVTPKIEPAKKTEEPTAPEVVDPTQVTPESRIAAIDAEMREMESSVLGDTAELDAQSKKKYQDLLRERITLATGEAPIDLTQPPPVGTPRVRQDLSEAPPPFTSETPEAPKVEFTETQKPPTVKPEDVTQKVTEPSRVIPEDLTTLTDDQLIDADSIARQTNDQDAITRIDAESAARAERAALDEIPPGEERPAGDQRIVAEDTQQRAGVPGDEALTGERGQDPVPGLTIEETAELDALWKKPKATKTDLDRIDELQAKIPAQENLRTDAPKTSAALLIRRGRATGLEIANRIREDGGSLFADLTSHLAERFPDSLGSLKVKYNRELEGANYDPNTHTMEIGERLLDDYTIGHELVHAVTSVETSNALHAVGMDINAQGLDYVNGLRKAQNNPNLPTPVRDLIGQYFHALDAFDVNKKVLGKDSIANKANENAQTGPDGVQYGLLNLDEFLAEAFTNRTFQNLLNRIPDPRGGTVWTRIVDAVSKILGVKADQKSLLTAVLKSGLDIGDLQSKGNSEAAAGVRPAPLPKPDSEKPYIDRGQPPNEPLEAGMETKDNGLVPSKEITPETTGPIGQSPNKAALRFAPKPESDGQTAQKPKTFLEGAFDKIKNLPIIRDVADSKIAKRIQERLKPAVQDLRESIEAKFRGMEFVKNNAATQTRNAIAIAFGRNKADMEAAYPILEAGGGRIGDTAPTEAEFRKRDGSERELGALGQHRKSLVDQLDVIQTTIDRLNRDATNDLNTPEEQLAAQKQLKKLGPEAKLLMGKLESTDTQIAERQKAIEDFDRTVPPTPEEVRRQVQYQLENGRKALESPVVSDEAKAVIRKFLPSYERALADFDRLIPGVKRVKEAFDDAYKLRASVDPDAHYLNDYVARVYELNKQRGNSPLAPETLIGGGKSGITSFDHARKYDTIMDAMIGRKSESGWEFETPKSFDVSDLAANHTAISTDIVSNKMLLDNFETTSYPETNEPLFIPKPKVGEALPPNYVRVDGPFKQPVFVYQPVADLFKSIFGESQPRNTDVGSALLKTSGAIKHGTLALDTFHLSRVIQKSFMEAVASGDWQKVADFKKNLPSYTEQGEMGKYLGTLDIAPKDVDAAIKAGELTPEAGAWVKGEGQILKRRAESGGLLAGKFTDNMWKEAQGFLKTVFETVHLPKGFEKLEQFNKFTFDRVTKSAMLSAFESRVKRLDKDFPELTEHQRNIKAAKEVNEQFGNLGRGGLLKSKTAQDYAQIFMLAPNWVQSQVMAEARQYGQGARAIFDATVGKKLPNGERERVLRVGNSARFLATTALSVFAANQVINLATRGKPTWENEEEGHKFDAWVPGGKTGFFYSPIALASEYAHHLHNYGQYESLPSAISHIASNKLSPLAGAAKVALTQKDYTGKRLTPGETAVATVRQALPVPILASSALKGVDSASKAGTTQQNLLRSAGISTDRAPDAVAQGYQKFAPYRTKERPDTGPSVYKDLKTLVQNGETPAKIKAEVERLKKEGKKIEDIRRSFDFKNLSGSLANDLKAMKEKPELKKVLEAAKKQKQDERRALEKALQTK